MLVALLKDGRETRDEQDVLYGVSGVSNHIIKNRVTQNAIRMFLKMGKRAITWMRDAGGMLRSN